MIEIELPWPPSVNRNIRMSGSGGRFHVHESAEFVRYKRAVRELVSVAGLEPVDGPLQAELMFVPPNRRRRDAHNLEKVIFDALEGLLYHNDAQIVAGSWWLEEEPDAQGDGGVVVRIQPIERRAHATEEDRPSDRGEAALPAGVPRAAASRSRRADA